ISGDNRGVDCANGHARDPIGMDARVAQSRVHGKPTMALRIEDYAPIGTAGLRFWLRKKIDDGGFKTPYRLRKQVVEPVFGQIKQARGFRQFLLRGGEKVAGEGASMC